MEVYSNENEQVDVLKNFFAENGKSLVVGVILGVGALIGWRYWNNHQESRSRETSAAYQQVITALDAGKPATLEAATTFARDNNNNTYGVLASLDLAKYYVDNNQLGKAAAQLQNGLQDTKDANLQAIMNLRLARIQLQQKQPDAALKTLENIKDSVWRTTVEDIRGEALLSKGDIQGAREAWSTGVASDTSSTLKEMLKMKMNNLPG